MEKTNTKKTTAKKTNTKKATPKKQTPDNSGKKLEIMSICLGALSIILFLSVYTTLAGKLGKLIAGFMRGMFGVGAYLIPVMIVGMVIHFFISKADDKKRNYIMLSVALVDIMALFHVLLPSRSVKIVEIYKYSCENYGLSGGILGALISAPLISLVNYICTVIILLAIFAILMVLVFNVSFSKLFAAMFRGIKNLFTEAKKEADEMADDEEEIPVEKKKRRRQLEDDDIPLPEPPPEREYWEPEDIGAVMHEPEINIYNDKPQEEEPEKIVISDDEKQSIQEEIASEIAENEEVMVYNYPSLDLLEAPDTSSGNGDMSKELRENAVKLVEALKSFHVDAQVVEISCGPTVTRYEVKPAAGVRVNQITNLSKDIALKLSAKGGVMIAPVPGKSTIGIEIANANPSKVTLREVIESDEFKNHKSKLAVALGKDISGAPVIMDLAKMPHLLIAGATGAGKSVCINTLIVSLMYKADPSEVKLVMIDPKQVELGVYNGIPHLLIPVVKDAKKATGALSWAVQEMTERYSTFEKHNVRNIQGYNALMEEEGTPENKMPSIVIIIDEFADLMMVAPGDVENYVCRIAQLARAAGMHLVIATQRPVVKFITGNIKANVPSRISFMVASAKDSITILDMAGAEKLVGKGDMLYMPVGETKPARMQCAFVSDDDVKAVVNAVTENCEAVYDENVIEQLEKDDEYKPDGEDPGDADELLPEAIEMAVDSGQISTSLLQRRFRIGYNRAGSIIDQMEARGIISGLDGNRPRQVLITRDQYNEMLMK